MTVYAARASNTPSDDRNNDVRARSRFAAWVHETGEDARLPGVAHQRASTASDRWAPTTYVYGPNPPDGTYNFTGVPGSDRAGAARPRRADQRPPRQHGWNEPTWRDRGIDTAYFGEINPSAQQRDAVGAPGDGLPRRRRRRRRSSRSRASATSPRARSLQGIIKYFAEKDGVTAAAASRSRRAALGGAQQRVGAGARCAGRALAHRRPGRARAGAHRATASTRAPTASAGTRAPTSPTTSGTLALPAAAGALLPRRGASTRAARASPRPRSAARAPVAGQDAGAGRQRLRSARGRHRLDRDLRRRVRAGQRAAHSAASA